MLDKIRQKLLDFINSDTDVPLLAGFSTGLYVLLFYYSKNFSLANSYIQFISFFTYYIVLPTTLLHIGFKIIKATKYSKYGKQFLFVGVVGFLSFYLLQISNIAFSKAIVFVCIMGIAVLLSFRIGHYYKFLVVLLFALSLFNTPELFNMGLIAVNSSSEWKKQPDNIESVIFKNSPNIYYIQPDGYTSFTNLKDSIHNFDNSSYEGFLKDKGFTLYPDYRSNYYSTLLSNAATFSMKHHYIEQDVEKYRARSIIMNDNPVVRILKNNNYTTHFFTESPYLIINRPAIAYDYTNIAIDELPYIKDGLSVSKNVLHDFKSYKPAAKSGNFFFIEKFTPSHITVYESESKGAEQEKKLYLQKIKEANKWLTDIIGFITKSDSNALIIIGADHGGFAGFSHTLASSTKTKNPYLIKSMFGAHMAIKWPLGDAALYGHNLKSGVNLFRIVFGYLGDDINILSNLQENGSYVKLSEPVGLYKYINNHGETVFEKAGKQ